MDNLNTDFAVVARRGTAGLQCEEASQLARTFGTKASAADLTEEQRAFFTGLRAVCEQCWDDAPSAAGGCPDGMIVHQKSRCALPVMRYCFAFISSE
jgi:hypothetical protein